MTVRLTIDLPNANFYREVEIINTCARLESGAFVYQVLVARVLMATVAHHQSDGLMVLSAKALAALRTMDQDR